MNVTQLNVPRRTSELARSVRAHLPEPGLRETPIESVYLFRADEPSGRAPCIYEPCIVIVIQGAKRGYLGNAVFDYDTDNYVVFSVPTPMEAEIMEASSDRPFLGVAIGVVPAYVADLQMQLARPPAEMKSPKSVTVSPIDGGLAGTLRRLCECLENPDDARVLGPMIVREIHYRVLTGNQGDMLLAAVDRHSHYQRIHQLLRTIQDDCSVNLDTTEMARIANMSKSSLHDSFKSITSMTPLQYLKSIRLHRARSLMVNEGLSAGAAAYRVGYASPSQFSREFKRLFGHPPSMVAQFEQVAETAM